MSQELANSPILNLAWARLLFDREGHRCFLTHPFLLDLVRLDLENWLEGIRRRVAAGYQPSSCGIVEAPKGNWQVRPGGNLRLEDELIFNAVLGRNLPNIEAELRDLQGDLDVSYQLPRGENRRDWVHRGFTVWREYTRKSKERLERGTRYVLFTDISASMKISISLACPRTYGDSTSTRNRQNFSRLALIGGLNHAIEGYLKAILRQTSLPRFT